MEAEYNLNEILKNVAQSSDITEWHYSLQNFETVGQNYFGVLVPLLLTGTDHSGNEVSLRLVLKLAPTDKRFRLSDAVTRMFDREIFIYSEVLSKYQEIQRTLPTTHYVIPKCVYTCKNYCEEVIVMQDMREEGYTPHSEGIFLDLDHIILSVKSLSKLHALSFITRQKYRNLYNDIIQKCVPLNEITDKRYMDVMKDRLLKALDKFASTDYVPLLTTLKENCNKYIRQVTESTAETCICHGDIWKENILFKYKDSKPVEACLIDYQTSRMGCPAFDILYLITSSTNSNLRHSHFDQLLDIYYQTFEEFVNIAGYDTANLYSRKAFKNDLKIVGPACLIVANTALWLSNGLQQEGHVKSKQILSTDEEKMNAALKYISIIKSIMDDFSSYGTLSIAPQLVASIPNELFMGCDREDKYAIFRITGSTKSGHKVDDLPAIYQEIKSYRKDYEAPDRSSRCDSLTGNRFVRRGCLYWHKLVFYAANVNNKKYQRTEKLLVDYMPTNPLFAAEEFTGYSALKKWTLLAEKGCTSLQQEGGVTSAYLQALRQMNKLLKELVAENRLSNRLRMKKPKCSRQSLLYQ